MSYQIANFQSLAFFSSRVIDFFSNYWFFVPIAGGNQPFDFITDETKSHRSHPVVKQRESCVFDPEIGTFLMKIVSLRAENFKRLTAVQIDPTGNVVEITGENAQGKSSILDAIWAAIGGKAAAPVRPVRIGEEVALIEVDLGELKITRRFINRDDGDVTTTLTVENADGHRQSPPQDILNALTNSLTFDPLEFARKPEKDQATMLRGLVPDYDFTKTEDKISDLEEQRRQAGRKKKQAEAERKGVEVPDDAPGEHIETTELLDQLAQAASTNQEISRDRIAREQQQNSIDEALQQASDIQQQIVILKKKADEATAYAESQQVALDGLSSLDTIVDIDDLRVKLREAEAQNKIFELVEAARRHDLAVTSADDDYQSKDTQIKKLRKEMATAVRKANLPVKGLEFDESGVLLNSLPFAQASQAEQLRTAIAVAVALDPKLRVLRVRDGALLGSSSMEDLSKFAEEFDMQIWIETVESGRGAAIRIENGCLAADAVQAAE